MLPVQIQQSLFWGLGALWVAVAHLLGLQNSWPEAAHRKAHTLHLFPQSSWSLLRLPAFVPWGICRPEAGLRGLPVYPPIKACMRSARGPASPTVQVLQSQWSHKVSPVIRIPGPGGNIREQQTGEKKGTGQAHFAGCCWRVSLGLNEDRGFLDSDKACATKGSHV